VVDGGDVLVSLGLRVLGRFTAEDVRDPNSGEVLLPADTYITEDQSDLIDKTGVNRLTPPSRAATGIEMLAVCGRRDMRDDAAAGEDIRNELLSKKIDELAAKSYADLRKRAIIVKR
jgi:hypothetical protein